MLQLRLADYRLTGFIPWSCSCEAKAPARAPGGAGFKGQRPLRTVSPPFNLCLALIGLASIRNLLPRFGCTFVLAMISSVLSDFSVFFLLRRLLLERGGTRLVFTMRAAQGAASEVRWPSVSRKPCHPLSWRSRRRMQSCIGLPHHGWALHSLPAPLPRAAPPGALSIAEHPLNAARRRSNDLIVGFCAHQLLVP